jgi:hypothetical protein
MRNILSKKIHEEDFELMLDVYVLGNDLLFTVFNENGHLGGVAMGSYDERSSRAYSSVFCYPGHRDDLLAKHIAQRAAKRTKRNTCAIVGIHIESIDRKTIDAVIQRVHREIEIVLEEIGRQLLSG